MSSRRGPAWLSADVLGVLVFCAVGRRSHDEGVNITGIASTAWPFLSGTVVGWLVSRAWRRPTAVVSTGLIVWLCTVVVGMLLRKASSAGVGARFVAWPPARWWSAVAPGMSCPTAPVARRRNG